MKDEPVSIRRAGILTPLEIQLRRVDTRAAFLVLELEKLEDLDKDTPMTRDETIRLAERIGVVDGATRRILNAHGWTP